MGLYVIQPVVVHINNTIFLHCLSGGIRCEKASIMLKRKGVSNVAQLSGGIHRYLERYGRDGFFKGLSFTFDKRVAVKPDMSPQYLSFNADTDLVKNAGETYDVVGKCVECSVPFVSLTCRRTLHFSIDGCVSHHYNGTFPG
jgi:predicted sulfurtransferase